MMLTCPQELVGGRTVVLLLAQRQQVVPQGAVAFGPVGAGRGVAQLHQNSELQSLNVSTIYVCMFMRRSRQHACTVAGQASQRTS